jgi:hypothetical protein
MHSSCPHAYNIPCLSHPPWLRHSNYIQRRVQVKKLIIVQFAPTNWHSIHFRSKYSPQNPALKYLSVCSSLNFRDQVSHSYKTTGKFIVRNILIFGVLGSRPGDKRSYWTAVIITRIQSSFNFLMNQIMICHCRSQTFPFCHMFETSVSYIYVTILPCILVTRQQHVLSSLCVSF